MNPIIVFENVALGYGSQPVVKGLSLKIYPGQYWGFIGPNGSGKTTILKAILGILPPLKGHLYRDSRLAFGYCQQRKAVEELFPCTVREIALMARTRLAGLGRPFRHEDRAVVEKCLRLCGVGHLSEKLFSELSGGQKQRVLLARALATEPQVLLLDEPTTDLDLKGSREILQLVAETRKQLGLTVVLVSHELPKVINEAEYFLFLQRTGGLRVVSKDQLNAALLSQVLETEIFLKNGKNGILVY
ncbi:MAG TPA: ATP-binding cassette domain-containing protein [bacterium]|nr:ATP-binding cassette domain-containing protein [bacterium]HOL67024.1 ATP-binding cassette domain-containing protein [bacterium]HPP12549.1 ATP-binding cassette domain-containing protein [bacterium]